MDSDNPTGADNQQERPGFAQWVVGFVDGEGCFSAPIFRNRTCRIGWQVQPTFAVVQAERSVQGLTLLERYFRCGHVCRFARHDNHREPLCRYEVGRLSDLEIRIIPFFEEHPLITAKANDFVKFATIVRMMRQGHHRSVGGLAEIARIVETMNRRQPSRYLESSEAIRQPRRSGKRREDMVRTP